MGIRAGSVHTLLDVVQGRNPDGSSAYIAEVLQKSNSIFDDMSFKIGNLDTGDRSHVRTKNAGATWTGPNQGILPTKGATRSIDEKAAYLESDQSVDRKLAIMSGNPLEYRKKAGVAHINGMSDEFVTGLFYGNAAVNENQFTGFAPRFNSTADKQVLDVGGDGTKLRSIWLVGWHEDTVTGIVSKEGHSGLQHLDTTANQHVAEDGYPVGDRIDDGTGTGATYLGYTDRWSIQGGLSIPDPRFVVRGANIDLDDLTKDGATVDLEDILIQMQGMFGVNGNDMDRVNATFYMPRELQTWFRRQEARAKKGNLGWSEIGGRKILDFDGIPIRRTDALNVNEGRVVA